MNEELTPEAIASTMMHGIGFSRDALIDVPGRFDAVRLLLLDRGFWMKLDPSDSTYWAEKYRE